MMKQNYKLLSYVNLMDTIPQNLPNNLKKYFNRLSEYLDTPLYFYGSITRGDYIPGKSDIDIAVFDDNEYSIMAKLQHFLHVKRSNFSKVVWKLNNKMIYGYKIKCKKHTGIDCEISVYNNYFKDMLLEDYRSGMNPSLTMFVFLYILKFFYYNIPLLSKQTYLSIKKKAYDVVSKHENSEFLVLKDN